MNCAAMTIGKPGAVAWCGGANMCIGAMSLGSVVHWYGHHSHLAGLEWCRRHGRQALAAAQAHAYIVAAGLLHTNHILGGLLLGDDVWLRLALRLHRWQQIPGNHTEWCSIRCRCPGHRSSDVLVLLLQLQQIVGQRAVRLLWRLSTLLRLLLVQGHQLRLLHLHSDILGGCGGC